MFPFCYNKYLKYYFNLLLFSTSLAYTFKQSKIFASKIYNYGALSQNNTKQIKTNKN